MAAARKKREKASRLSVGLRLARSISAFSTTGAIAPTTLSVTLSCRSKTSSSPPKLSRDAHSVCRFANAPFQHVAHPKLAPDLLHVDGATLVCEARVAGDDEQRLEMG